MEIWAKYRKMFPKSLYVLWFYKKAPKIKMQTFLFWRSYLYLVLFGQISGNLGKFGGNLGKMALEVFFGFKKYAEHEKKRICFFGDHFLWIFWAIWGILGKNPSHPQKFACSYTYACFFHLWSEVTWILPCASLNHRKNMKAERSRMISRKLAENLELSIVRNWQTFANLVRLPLSVFTATLSACFSGEVTLRRWGAYCVG